MRYKLEDVVGKYGIISHFNRHYSDHVPTIPIFKTAVYPLWVKTAVIGGGVSIDAEEAKIKAIAEGLERYSTMTYHMRNMIFGSYRYLISGGKKCVSPNIFKLYSDLQYKDPAFPYMKPSDDIPLWWTKVTCLNNNEVVYYPSEFIYLNFPNKFHCPLSTGAAIHKTYELAKINSILEVVERDAIMLVWKREMQIPQIDKSTINDIEINYFIKKFQEIGYCINIYDMTMEHGIPTVIITCKGSYGLPALSVAAGISITLCKAIKKALNELVLAVSWSVYAFKAIKNDSDVKWDSLEQHSVFYLNPENVGAINFLSNTPIYSLAQLSSMGKTYFSMEKPISSQIVNCLNKFGFTVYCTETTSKDVAQVGFHSCKSIIPQMLPLDVEEPFNGVNRLYNIEKLVNWRCNNTINSYPQPFA